MTLGQLRGRGFSLVELVIVVVIIGIIAAIAVPRMSRGARGASDSALSANLSILRNAITMFETENGSYPTATNFVTQLTTFSDGAGNTSATKTGDFIYGPYLQTVPPLPVGAKKGKNGIAAADGANVGWIYVEATGTIRANCADAEVDERGVKYNTY
ncbi:MAG: prepilin-type N-terminal cleavage/methylation domain-containing protein [Phycisphaeraceae bacterium]|nr:MAG: prepilin-type N-terminal cleavage/methylation domain-containing protein [Phycisphaeraceae bacterium]